MKRIIKESLQAFTFKDLQTFRNIVLTIQSEGHTIDEVLDYISERITDSTRQGIRLNEEQMKSIEVLDRKCPSCGAPLRLFPIEQENESGWKSVWRCSSCIGCKKKDRNDETDPNKRCTFEEFSKRLFQEYVDEYNAEVKRIIDGG